MFSCWAGRSLFTFASCSLASRFIVQVDVMIGQLAAQMEVMLRENNSKKQRKQIYGDWSFKKNGNTLQ